VPLGGIHVKPHFRWDLEGLVLAIVTSGLLSEVHWRAVTNLLDVT